MKLIDILVRELPKRGGWLEGADYVVQDNDGSCDIKFGAGEATVEYENRGVWVNNEVRDWGINTSESYIRGMNILADDATASIITHAQYETALAAAQQPVWNGEGLPPVGLDICVIPHNNCWGFSGGGEFLGKVLSYDGEDFWFKLTNGVKVASRTDKVDFEPIRSEADKKREEAINDIASLIGRGTFFEDATRIYDAIVSGEIKLSD